MRDERVSRFPDDFGWIHAFDALEAARSVGVRPGFSSALSPSSTPAALQAEIAQCFLRRRVSE